MVRERREREILPVVITQYAKVKESFLGINRNVCQNHEYVLFALKTIYNQINLLKKREESRHMLFYKSSLINNEIGDLKCLLILV